MNDFLPDTRCRIVRNVTRHETLGNLVPVHCANCGIEWGWVPEDKITFAFCLCQSCADKHGDPAHFHKEPDSVFWERLANELREQKLNLTPITLENALSDPNSTLSKLADEWQAHVRNNGR